MPTDILSRITEQADTPSTPLEITARMKLEKDPHTVIYLVGCNTVPYNLFFLIVIGESNLLAT